MKVCIKEGHETALETMRSHEQARIKRTQVNLENTVNKINLRKMIASY